VNDEILILTAEIRDELLPCLTMTCFADEKVVSRIKRRLEHIESIVLGDGRFDDRFTITEAGRKALEGNDVDSNN